jgi:aspartate/methionine/tyrosine aminotransferase
MPGFRTVPKTGVIYVMSEANKHGFRYGSADWSNLGQGSPETGAIPGAPARIEQLVINPAAHRYSDVQGNFLLRQKVADYYNQLFRQGKKSQYTWENVSIAGGGRIALTRLAAALGNINMGHFLPDYTAYEELLSVFKAFIPIPILLDTKAAHHIPVQRLREEILGRGLRAVLASNPCNPTGQAAIGKDLAEWVGVARETDCSLILDEFYSHFLYVPDGSKRPYRMLSAAEFIDDVNEDPVVIVNGLTKNWRYPGWRISWTLGPKHLIDAVASAGSFLDGGANHPFQEQAISLLETELAIEEALAIQSHFGKKRRMVLDRLSELGITVDATPSGTFYVWANLSLLPEPINDGYTFFQKGLQEKVITVPGIFFDVNPESRRRLRRYGNHTRISFGPELEQVERGLDAIERMIKKFS